MDISLKDYLAQWKALIEKFFANNPKYAEEFANQMKAYLDGKLFMPSFAEMR